jgi:serine phosphatase RsbU (regulator of sigma subunit)
MLPSIYRKLWPELEDMSLQNRLVGQGDIFATLVAMPLAIIGLIWLALTTDLQTILANWQMFLLMGLLIILFNRLSYFIIVELRNDRYGSADGSLVSAILWSGIFLFGPAVLWLPITGKLAVFIYGWGRTGSKAARWNSLRNLALEMATLSLASLVALIVYQALGGTFPFLNFDLQYMLPALAALGTNFLMVILVWSPYLVYGIWAQTVLTKPSGVQELVRFMLLALGLPFLALPFSVLLAGLYTQFGVDLYLFLVFGLVLVAILARRLSWAVEASRQKGRQLERLEQLGREILESPPDASRLAELLQKHVPLMFPSGRVAIWVSGEGFLHKHPDEWEIDCDPLWEWISREKNSIAVLAKEVLPWLQKAPAHSPCVLAPIQRVEDLAVIGFVYLELRSLAQPWDRDALSSLFPAVHSLAAQVASTLYQAQVYRETLDFQVALQELEFASRIQASFLPNEVPILSGWELAVTLLPARNMSGDYFDFIPLEDGKIGILIADVVDKGLGAALYMALSRTLIRTYALEFELQPDLVFFSTNERILQDARANLFVTAFYGVLDVKTGHMAYCNAGHNPPFLIRAQDGGRVEALSANGMPIGVDADAFWRQAEVHIAPGDVLLLYTDGIPDAQDSAGEHFKDFRMINIAQENLGTSAQEIQRSVLDSIEEFVGEAPQFDDITLLVVMRESEG